MCPVLDRMLAVVFVALGLLAAAVESKQRYVPLRIYYWNGSLDFEACNRTFTSDSNISHVSFLTEAKNQLHFVTEHCYCIFHNRKTQNGEPQSALTPYSLENINITIRMLQNGTIWPVWFNMTGDDWFESNLGVPSFNVTVHELFHHPKLFISTGYNTTEETESPTSIYIGDTEPLSDIVLTCSPSKETFSPSNDIMNIVNHTTTGQTATRLVPYSQASTMERNLIIGLSGSCAFLLLLTVIFLCIINRMRKNINKLKNNIPPKQVSLSNRSIASVRYTPDGYLQPLPSIRDRSNIGEISNGYVHNLENDSNQLQPHEYLDLVHNPNVYEELQPSPDLIGDQEDPASSALNSRRPSGSYQQIDDETSNVVISDNPNPYLVLVS